MLRKIIFLLFISLSLCAQDSFVDFFSGETMRLDFVLSGDFESGQAWFSGLRKEKDWFGPHSMVKEPHLNGNFFFQIKDSLTGRLIYEKSFNTLFGEWQTTAGAKADRRAFQQTVYFPCPARPFSFQLFRRVNRHGRELMLELQRDPSDFLIPRDRRNADYVRLLSSGSSHDHVDLAFLAEGYTKDQRDKFLQDVERISAYLFSIPPFIEEKQRFNIHAVFVASDDSGTDNAGQDFWPSTALESGFYTFGLDRYLTTADYWRIADALPNVPKDHICVLVNSEMYGGGGIFNFYSLSTADHYLSEVVFVHELGHGFAGLGDEYYTSEVAYEDFFDLSEEPLAPNLTTLVDFESKWKDMIDEGVPVPTPDKEEYWDKTGVFEGGAYVAKGVYRPEVTCKMKSNQAPGFCRVCQEAIRDMILYYSAE